MRNSFLFSLFIAASITLQANPITQKQALSVAKNFLIEKNFLKKNIADNPLTLLEIKKIDNKEMCYIFSIYPQGFVIIAASDNHFPVIGYSFENNYKNHIGTDLIFDSYSKTNNTSENQSAVASAKTVAQWAHYLSSPFVKNESKAVVLGPLMSTKWNQDKYYNAYCPWDKNAGLGYDYRVPVGCVALAAAQIMFYYRFPESGIGGVSYVPAPYPRQTIQFSQAHYNWDAMNNVLTNYNGETAELIYHVGVATQMGYSASGSGTYTELAAQKLHDNFKYGNAWHQLCQPEGGDTLYHPLILIESLDELHPILYSGHPASSAGHAFVIDGYDDAGLFHLNWGWGGYSDGYFRIDNLLSFNVDACAILDLVPNPAYYNIQCAGMKRQTALFGSIASGSPIVNYQPQPSCSWMIAAPDAAAYRFTFNRLSTTPNQDIVTIYNGPNESDGVAATFSGTTTPTGTITVNADSVLITFNGTATTNTQYKGFVIDYSTTPAATPYCSTNAGTNGDWYFHLTDGSPADEPYRPSTVCTWNYRPQYTTGFSMGFSRFELNYGDFVEIYDATTTPPTLYERFDINKMPEGTYLLNFNKANVKFVADNWAQGNGFELDSYVIQGINDNDVASNLSIYPNPAENQLNIEGINNSNEPLKCSLIDVSGRVILSITLSASTAEFHQSIDLSQVRAGFYLLYLENKQGRSIQKVTVK